MNEDARDGNSPTGQALGNLALLVAAPLTVAGGLYGGYRLAKGGLNLAKKAGGKISETAENAVSKYKSAKDLKNIAKDIKKDHGSEVLTSDIKSYAEQQQMDEKYIKQNNPKMSQEEIKTRAKERTAQNVETSTLHKDIDVTGDMDGVFAVQEGFEGMNMPKGHAEYATGNSHNMPTVEREAAAKNPDAEFDAHARAKNEQIKNSSREGVYGKAPRTYTDEAGELQTKIERREPHYEEKGAQQSFLDNSGNIDPSYGAEERKAKAMRDQAHQNVMEKNSAFSQKNPQFHEPTGDQIGFDLDNIPEAKHVEATPQIEGQQSMFGNSQPVINNEPRKPSGSRKVNRNANRGTRTLGAPEVNSPTDFTKNVTQNTKVNMPEKEFKGFAGYDANGNPIYV